MSKAVGQRKFKIKPWRRLIQVLVLAMLILVPWQSQNPEERSPSRLAQGHFPAPVLTSVTGDTWNFSAGDFRLSHPVAFIEATLSHKAVYLPLALATLLPLALTVVLGRVFCSWLCPVGFLLELNMRFAGWLKKKGLQTQRRLVDLRYPILIICLLFSFIFAFPVISALDPPHTLGRELMYFATHGRVSLFGMGLLAGLFLLDSLIAKRGCCSRLCPSGAALALLGKYRLFRIKMAEQRCISCGRCDETCPYDLAPMGLATKQKFDWTTCDNCGRCRDSCPVGAISYHFGPTHQSP